MLLVKNPTALREYEITKEYQAGLALTGAEVKSLRHKAASLKGSYVKLLSGEAFLINAQINPYSFADNSEYDPKRTRKLLLNRKELEQIASLMDRKNSALVPLAFSLVHNRIKLLIGIGRGKKEHEKRSDLRKKAIQRDVERELKTKVRL